MGDAVFEICVRRKLISEHNMRVNELNIQARKLVNAAAQAKMYSGLKEYLTQEEADIMRRGRNARAATVTKSATVSEYRHATGLEALFGYLYLNGHMERIDELFDICVREC